MVAACNLQSAITASKLNLQGALTPLTQLRARHPLALKRGQAEVAITPFLARYHNSVLTSKASLRKRHALHVVGQGDQPPVAEARQEVLRFVDLQAIAQMRGMYLGLKTLGPVYRIVCRDGNSTGAVLATTSGFVLPTFKLMHCDTMQVFTPRLAEADRERIRGGSFFGLSLLIVAAIMSHGHACGCVKAEMLAINDDDHQHGRLVRYYTRMGFEKVLEVGNNGLSDLPHLLVWGGAGTRMNCHPKQFLQQWASLLKRNPKLTSISFQQAPRSM